MTLRQKTLLLIGSMLVSLIAILYVVSHFILLEGVARLEYQNTYQNMERVRDGLADDLANLEALAADWAKWDDTWAFVEDGNDDYIQANLVDETFRNLRLNLLLFIHSSGRLVYGRAFDLQAGQERPVPPGLLEHLSPDHPLWRPPEARTSATGIVVLPEGPLLVAAWPILTSEGQGPGRGTLLMGRWLDEPELTRLAARMHLTLTLQLLDAPALLPDWQTVRPTLSGGTPIAVQTLDPERVAGYVLIEDIYGQPALALRAGLPRSIYQQGQASVQFYLFSLLALGLLFGVTTLLLVEKTVLSRLTRFHADVSRVSRDPATRVQVIGRDELATLAIAINEMLDSLAQAGTVLRQSKEFNESIVQSMAEGIAVEDAAGYFTFLNPAAEALLGYAPGELLGQHWTAIAPPDQQPIIQAADERRARGEADHYEVELVRRNGTRLAVLVAGSPRFEGGRFAGTIAVFTDITARKQAEEERARLLEAERRQRELAETLYEQLKKAQEQLVQSAKMAAIGQLAAGVAHEINNPMTSVLGFAELLLRKTAPDEPAHQSLTIIVKEARRVRNIVLGLLSFARQTEFQTEWAAVNQVVQETLDLLRQRLSKGDVTVQENYAPDLPLIRLDSGRMKQVFLNLIVNALHAMPQGGTLTVTTEQVNDEVAICIADTGVGIPPENLSRLFEPFFTTQPVGQGTGLGLSISLGIVQDHGGRIEVTSQVGAGSTFTVFLPTGRHG